MQWKSRERMPALGLMLAAVLTLFPVVGHALGLGKLKVLSALNEPLNAEVEFTSITEKELKGLNAGLAPRADFDTAGVERAPYLSQIKFTVSKRLDGKYFLQIRTEQPMEEPFLHMLLQVEWPGGRLVHEYTALIDPPYRVAGKPAAIEAPRTSAPVTPPAPPVPTAQAEVAPLVEAKPPESVPEEPKPKVDEAAVTTAAVPAESAPTEAPAPEAVAAMEKPAEEKLGPPETPAAVPEAAPEAELAPKVEPLAAAPREDVVVPPEQAAPAPAAEIPVAAEEPSAPAAPQAAPAPASVPEYAVKKGDTLWQIASQVRGDRQISVEQVILALYRTNKDAFFGNNVNNLKTGKILKLPESEAIESVSAPDARKEFRAQYNAWQEYKLKLAGSSRAIKLTETDASVLAAAEAEAARLAAEKAPAAPQDKAQETAKPEQKTSPADKGKQEELLKIVRSTIQSEKGAPDKKVAETESAKDAGTKERQALADRAATLEESLESKRLENKELSEKIGMVRSQLKKESRLIELESQSLAQAQKKPAETKAAEPAAKPVPAPVAKVEPPKTAEPVPEKAATPPAPAPAKAPEVVKKRVPPPPAPPKEEKGFLAGLLEAVQSDLLMPLLIGVVVLVSGGIALVYFRRRQKSIAEFEESILSADAISGDQPVTTSDTTGHPPAAAASGDTSFLSDFSQGGMGNIHTDEVDPIAEADVYLAYGRDETAEEILKEAVVKHPERHELKLKLLEIYHQRNDVAAFETMAEELYAAQGGRSSKVWDKVEEMGRKLNPDNPMFKGGAPKAGGSAPSKAAPAAAQNIAPPPPPPPAPVMDEAAEGIDFDLGTPAEAPASAEPALDFDLGESKPAASDSIDFAGTMKMETAAAEEKSGLESMDIGGPADNSLDFDIGGKIEMPDEISMGEPAAPNEVKWEPQTAAAAPAELSLETAGAPAAGGAQSAQWDETATKLDLAKAYIDMGDAEGARSILQEVISEGNDAQKKQAQELSAQIA